MMEDGRYMGRYSDSEFLPCSSHDYGRGRAVFMNDPLLKLIAESFRDWGRDCYCAPGRDDTCGKRFAQDLVLPSATITNTYIPIWIQSKINDMQAACGLAQLDSLETFIAKRRDNFEY